MYTKQLLDAIPVEYIKAFSLGYQLMRAVECGVMEPPEKIGYPHEDPKSKTVIEELEAKKLTDKKVNILKDDLDAMRNKISQALLEIYAKYEVIPYCLATVDLWIIDRDKSMFPTELGNTIVIDEDYHICCNNIGSEPPNRLLVSSKINKDSNDSAFVVFELSDWVKSSVVRDLTLDQFAIAHIIDVAEMLSESIYNYMVTMIDLWNKHKDFMKVINSIQWIMDLKPLDIDETKLLYYTEDVEECELVYDPDGKCMKIIPIEPKERVEAIKLRIK